VCNDINGEKTSTPASDLLEGLLVKKAGLMDADGP